MDENSLLNNMVNASSKIDNFHEEETPDTDEFWKNFEPGSPNGKPPSPLALYVEKHPYDDNDIGY